MSKPPEDDQVWFILKEDLKQQDFVQKDILFSKIKANGLALSDFLRILNLNGRPEEFSFHIHSASMAAAVRLLNDESILTTHRLYCSKDPVITIIIRDAKDPSPNTSKAPSHNNSLASRRNTARGRIVPELFLQPPSRHVSESMDVATMEVIEDEGQMVSVKVDDEEFVTFSKEYLTCWIASQLDDGKALTDIVVSSYGPNHALRKVALTADVWQHSLIRGPWANDFLPLWDDYNRAASGRDEILADCIKKIPGFSKSCENFIHDLRCYGGDKAARKRLDGTGHEFYLGRPYFDTTAVSKLLIIPTHGGTLAADLRHLAEKRAGGDICAAHDLAPIFESVLKVKWNKDASKGVALHEQFGGLTLQSNVPERGKAKQIVQKGSQFFRDTFRKKRGGGGTSGGG